MECLEAEVPGGSVEGVSGKGRGFVPMKEKGLSQVAGFGPPSGRGKGAVNVVVAGESQQYMNTVGRQESLGFPHQDRKSLRGRTGSLHDAAGRQTTALAQG